VLPVNFEGSHLQILDLARWFSPTLQSPGNPWPARFRGGSRVEPLVDGIATYTRLIEDFRRASGIHLGGWAFEETRLRPYDPTTALSALLDSIGREKFRILVTKPFQPKVAALDNLGTEALVALFILILAAEPLIALEKLGKANYKGILVWHAIAILLLAIEIATDPDAKIEDKLRNLVEFTDEKTRKILFDVSNGKFQCAFPAAHPVALADNPLDHGITIPGFGDLGNLQELWGVFHQKFQVIAFPNGNFAAYLGGIDLRANRIDAPGHQAPAIRQPDSLSAPAPSPFHDVHARVTGPAAFDMIGLFHERYHHALNFSPPGVINDPLYHPPATPPPPAFEPPAAPPPPAGQHLARIAQTSFKPAPGRQGFPWAPNGDAPIRETFERAIRSAREYIYIEDQYFTLDDGRIAALREAAGHCRRLVITVAAGTPDQLFGDERRFATFDRLSGATGGPGGWGDRMIAGYPYRRSVLQPADLTASLGRASLVDDVTTATASKIYVGPVPRVPTSTPYFFWVAGELMYATKARPLTSPAGRPSVELEVLRGSLHGTGPAWCEHPRSHFAGAPVTFSAPRDIFVHAKLLVVDDIFAAIGSANFNRRGFYHDGEVDVFAVPERLKASRDNPALNLRTQLWAEHLGLVPFMGRSLLADPIEAFELFRRTRCQGNRFSEHREFTAPRGDLSALNDFALFQIIPDSVRVTLIATANSFLATEVHPLWNTLFDPTTGADPNPQEGPEL
jgi:phosphatidylserine/phosphatidylglycerophosphate/cardiolipin synthase-like enzyme